MIFTQVAPCRELIAYSNALRDRSARLGLRSLARQLTAKRPDGVVLTVLPTGRRDLTRDEPTAARAGVLLDRDGTIIVDHGYVGSMGANWLHENSSPIYSRNALASGKLRRYVTIRQLCLRRSVPGPKHGLARNATGSESDWDLLAGPLPASRGKSISSSASVTTPRLADKEAGPEPVRILVDNSAYDLLNLGDVAMLQSCITRLRQQWPDAEIMVIAYAPERLQQYCPGTSAIQATFADLAWLQVFPRKVRRSAEQAWRIVGPALFGHFGSKHRQRGQGMAWPRTPIQAVRWADAVVVAGSGMLTDTWWWHAAGVLSLLDLAQRAGKPTAMFGQGIGPLHGRALRAAAGRVLPRLTVLGLREDVTSPALAESLGTPASIIEFTGDDAFEMISCPEEKPATGLGVNIRSADYVGIGADAVGAIGECLITIAGDLDAPLVALPISRYPTSSDLDAIRRCLRSTQAHCDIAFSDLSSPADLVSAASGCRAVVTCSYHAAVYALGQGIPAVCMTNSPYYDAKFGGLKAMFPGMCQVVSLVDPDWRNLLRPAIERAWNLPSDARSDARHTAQLRRDAGREAHAHFRAKVEVARPPNALRTEVT